MTTRVPLVLTAPVSEFGELPDPATFNDPLGMDRDNSYVPGFSEMRKAHDIKVAEYVNHRAQRSEIPVLPVNCRWARNQNKAGTPDSTKPLGHSQKGFRFATKADIGQPWLTQLPPGAMLGPGDVVVKGDTVLMVESREDAAKNMARKQRKTQERLTGLHGGIESNLREKGGTPWKGADPSVTKEPLSPIAVPVTAGR